jgi:putative tryptophan/tyrosine transport system substrate-binding protein
MMILHAALTVVLALALLAAPLAADAQQSAAIPRIGYLTPSSRPGGTAGISAFRDGLREHGYIDGTHVVIEPRFADGYERVPALLAELLNLRVDVLVVATTPVALAAQRATSTVPIVFAPVSDPVGSGLVTSLARPGGNITGYSDISADLAQKRLVVLSEVVPRMSRVGVLRHADNPGSRIASEELESAARQIGLKLYHVDVRHTADLEGAFATLTKARVQALIAIADLHLTEHVSAIARLATIRRLPLMGFSPRWSAAGALLAYGAAVGTQPEFSRQAAAYVVKILRGAKPAELPVQQPTKFELIINLKTAKTLGLTIPSSLLLQADQIIE